MRRSAGYLVPCPDKGPLVHCPQAVWSLMGTSGTPTADRQGPQGVQQEGAGSLGQAPPPSHTPLMPSPPRKCLVASTRGRGTSNRRPASGTGSLFFSNNLHHARRPSHTLSHLSPGKLQACVPLVQWPSPARCTPIPAAIDCGPAFFPANRSVCVFVRWLPSVTCQKHGGLVSPCAPAHWGRAACLVYLHGREGVPIYHTPSHPDRIRQPGPFGCKLGLYLPKLLDCARTNQWHVGRKSHPSTAQVRLLPYLPRRPGINGWKSTSKVD